MITSINSINSSGVIRNIQPNFTAFPKFFQRKSSTSKDEFVRQKSDFETRLENLRKAQIGKIVFSHLSHAPEILKIADALSVEKYNVLNEKEKKSLREFAATYNKAKALDARDSVNAAKYLKSKYDKEYGEGQWVYISIGRSCATIAKALEFMGVESKSIPISNLNVSSVVNSGHDLIERPGFEFYKEHIYNLGLNPDEVKTSGKKYIFQDYTASGKTLMRFEEFIRSQEIGLDFDNVIFKSINNDLSSDDIDETILDVPRLLDERINFRELVDVAEISKLDCDYLFDITKAAQSRSNLEEVQIFDFMMLDKLLNPKD